MMNELKPHITQSSGVWWCSSDAAAGTTRTRYGTTPAAAYYRWKSGERRKDLGDILIASFISPRIRS